MVDRVKNLLREGMEIRIFTARAHSDGTPEGDAGVRIACEEIGKWCEKHIGRKLPVTCSKDLDLIVMFDDRARQVMENTGVVVGETLYP